MRNLAVILSVFIFTACGTDENQSDAPKSKKRAAKKATKHEDQASDKPELTYEKPVAVVNPEPMAITPPVVVPGPAAEDPIVAQKIQEMDTLIQERVNLLMTWNVWDDYRDKIAANETEAHYFQLHSSHPWMKVGGLFGQEATFLDHHYTWWFGNKVYHCDELVDRTTSELAVYYTGRDISEKSKLYIEVYFYTPHENGPIYITKIKLNWKFSNGVEQESLKEANCQ